MLSLLLLLGAITISAQNIQSQVQSTGIQAVFPSDSSYSNVIQPFNLRYTYQPEVVAYPTTADQVAQLLTIASAANVSVSARSGGHSYAALGLAGSMVLDMSQMTAVTFDSTTNQATVQTGNHLGDLYLALNENGRAIAAGSCPFVGTGGHISNGGWGFASHQWGMTLDSVVAIEAVLANGTMVNITEASYPDLFFAFRGAGTSFGIVTAFTLATQAAPASVTNYDLMWTLPVDEAITQLIEFQNFVLSNNTPAALGTEVTIGKSGTQGMVQFHFNGAYFADASNFNSTVQPYLSTFSSQPNWKVSSGSWIEGMERLGNGQGLNTTADGKDYTDTFYAKSLMTPEASPMSNASISAFMNYVANQGASTDLNWFVQIETYGGANSAVNAVPINATAFAQRDKLFNIQFYASSSNYQPPYPDSGFTFLDDMVNTIISNEPADWPYAAYVNYIDSQFTQEQTHELYYGSNYERLSQLKAQYDPQDIFRFDSAIQAPNASNSSTPTATGSASVSGAVNNAANTQSASSSAALSISTSLPILSLALLGSLFMLWA